ncbi:SUKH-4 family immunity protein [Streptomyces triticisoli]|jgi:hypothetical protein|uniref:SUKH-4 family immunity protein n=1 Tax=Streptomyces triticisoli TaxID=2182797 RepID=UPI000DD8C728
MSTTDTVAAVITLPETTGGLRRRPAGLGPFRRAAALVAGPGTPFGPTVSGLALDLRARLLHQEFGQGRLARFEDVDFPVTLTHEPTRRFLRDTGLPEDGVLLQFDSDAPLPTLAEYYAGEHPDAHPELPARASHLIRLGRLVDGNGLLVDGTTGRVSTWSEARATLTPLAKDVSVLTLTLWLLHRALQGSVRRS